MNDSIEALVESIATATERGDVLPDLSETISLDQAYELQHRVTQIRSPEGAAGIKAGVTDPKVQGFFNLDHALLASLYGGTQMSSGADLSYVEGRLIETEVA